MAPSNHLSCSLTTEHSLNHDIDSSKFCQDKRNSHTYDDIKNYSITERRYMINYVIRLVDNENGINLFVKNLYFMFCI